MYALFILKERHTCSCVKNAYNAYNQKEMLHNVIIKDKQKNATAQYAVDHYNFSQNLLLNCSSGKGTSNRQWEQLVLTTQFT